MQHSMFIRGLRGLQSQLSDTPVGSVRTVRAHWDLFWTSKASFLRVEGSWPPSYVSYIIHIDVVCIIYNIKNIICL